MFHSDEYEITKNIVKGSQKKKSFQGRYWFEVNGTSGKEVLKGKSVEEAIKRYKGDGSKKVFSCAWIGGYKEFCSESRIEPRTSNKSVLAAHALLYLGAQPCCI